LKVYIASPFFNSKQIDQVEFIKESLTRLGYEYFSPKDYFVLDPNATAEDRKRIFDVNVEKIKWADFILCNTESKDLGTIWEAGFSYGIGKPVVFFAEGLPEGKFNVMLSEAGVSVNTTRDQLQEYLLDCRNQGFLISTPYTGQTQ
jgi:nucleoside 2-deoxyribosyltransferase